MTVVLYSMLLILAFFFTFVFVTAISWQMIDLLRHRLHGRTSFWEKCSQLMQLAISILPFSQKVGEHKEQVTNGLLKEVKISLFVNEVSVIDQFARLSFQQKVSLLVAIGVLIMAFWYFSPGILKGIYDAGYRMGQSIALWLKQNR